jgi:hypothetical protein
VSRSNTPLTGKAEGAILRVLRACSYEGTVARLGALTGFDGDWVAGALLRLSARGLVKVEAGIRGTIVANITTIGRQAIGQPQPH